MDNRNGKRYHSLNAYLKNRFGEKVYRVSIDAGFTCPNRDGSLSRGGCIYCNENGSRAEYVNPKISVRGQLLQGMEFIGKRYGAKKFIAYFQAYTNTYAPVEQLEKIYSEVLGIPEVIGISIGTRPDCIDDKKLDLIENIAKDKYTLIEYGVQTMKPETLERINRRHSVEDSIRAIEMTKKRTGIEILTHLIFGLPGETEEDMIENVRQIIRLKTDAVKFHHLYIEKNTLLAKMYAEQRFETISAENYLRLLLKIIPMLPENIVIHRLFGQSRKENLVAPLWTLRKNELSLQLDNLLKENNLSQGSLQK